MALMKRMLDLKSLTVIQAGKPEGGYWQMAVDQVLLENSAEPVLRWYRWGGAWGTFGCHQPLAVAQELLPGVSLVRRWTGGGIVDHRADTTFSLAIPATFFPADVSPRKFYELLHATVAGILIRQGVDCRLAGVGDSRPGEACFVSPRENDLLAAGGKVLGGAIRRSRAGVLYQGSIARSGLSSQVCESLAENLSDSWKFGVLEEKLRLRTEEVIKIRYGTQDWLERL